MRCYLCKNKANKKNKHYDYARKKEYYLCKSCEEIGLVILDERGLKK